MYWTANALSFTFSYSFYFDFSSNSGRQTVDDEEFTMHAWAVRDITPVPVPAAIWLFISGVASLAVTFRRKNINK